nr:MAG TPA: hypothetical protein [Bacteriophage sp.]
MSTLKISNFEFVTCNFIFPYKYIKHRDYRYYRFIRGYIFL